MGARGAGNAPYGYSVTVPPSPLLLALLACVRSREALIVEPAAEEAATSAFSPYLAVPNLIDAACEPRRCVALSTDGLHELATASTSLGAARPLPDVGRWDTIRMKTPGVVELTGSAPDGAARPSVTLELSTGALGALTPGPALTPLPLQETPAALDAEVASLAARWSQTRASHGRTPFARSLLDPGGGIVRFVRTMGGGQLVRTTAPGVTVAGAPGNAPARVHPATARVVTPESAAGWPAWLALHPSAKEAYLMAWPSASFVAFDPQTLQTRWTFPLEAPGHALFIDESGRFVVLAEGHEVSDRWIDWPVVDVGNLTVDPASDEVVRRLPQPPTSAVVVLDLARGEQLLRVPGALRRWATLPEGRAVLVTDAGLAFTTLAPLETPR